MSYLETISKRAVDMAESNGWHLDKRVSITLIMAITLQTIAGVWFISQLSFDVEALKAQNVKNVENGDRLLRVEFEVKNIKTVVERIDNKLDRQR